MPLSTDELAALDELLAEWDGLSASVSTLEAGLRDARTTMTHGDALWLAALGYLVTFELLGASVARRRTRFIDRSTSTACFTAGVREFSTRRISAQAASALYSLRCALAHEFGLRNRRKRVFQLTQVGPLVRQPRREWDGSPADAIKQAAKTRVNVRAIGDLAEEVVAAVRRLHQTGEVVLAPSRTADDLLAFGRFPIS